MDIADAAVYLMGKQSYPQSSRVYANPVVERGTYVSFRPNKFILPLLMVSGSAMILKFGELLVRGGAGHVTHS